MEKILICLIVVLLGLSAWSCVDDSLEHKPGFNKSYAVWQQFKADNNNSYYYIVDFMSWIGYHFKTKIVVKDGVITERNVQYTYYENGQLVEEKSYSWTEKGDELGIHDQGAALLTIDAVYKKAYEEWLIERENAIIYFKTENEGIISLCGYVENNCADDCFVGISISEIGAI